MSTSISATEIGLPDDAKLKLGTGEDLEIYHDGSNSYLTNGTGVFNLQGSGSNIQLQAVNGESGLIVKPDNAVELYFNGGKKCETTTSGVAITGDFGVNTTTPGGIIHGRTALSKVISEGTNDTISGLVASFDAKAAYYRKAGFRILDANDNEDLFMGRPYATSDTNATFVMNFHGTERFRFHADGTGLSFNGGLNAADALDDYEEGTFTPAFTQGYAYVNTITYSQQVGHYTKIGNQVFAYIYMRQTGNSSHSGNIITDGNILLIGGLPYTALNAAYTDGGGYLTYTNGFFGTSVSSEVFHPLPWVGANSSSVSFHTQSSGNNIVGNNTDPTNKYLVLHVRYRTA